MGKKSPFFERRVSRRDFLKLMGALACLVWGGGWSSAAPPSGGGTNARPKKGLRGDHDLVVAEGRDPYATTVKAVGALGGMERFVRKGGVVVVKPNIGWDRTPEQAADTHPAVVAAVVDLCFKAGAGRVNVFDVTCNDPRRCYDNSGIRAAAEAAGARVYFPSDWDTVKARFAYDSPMEGWPILRDALACDTFINVPVLKHHGLTRLTVAMKNLMGVCAGNRGTIHQNIGRSLVDLTDFIGPELTVVDATRVLLRHGPQGGDLADVERRDTVLAATDPVLADTYACSLMDVAPEELQNIAAARARGFGLSDLSRADIVRVG
ncbi:MAG: DUF362 domain-containing protein [Deltaproteobacteria bacterium]